MTWLTWQAFLLRLVPEMAPQLLSISSISSPICQEGQSERNFPIFAFSSRFVLFFPFFPSFSHFSLFSPSFSQFWAIFCCQGGTLPSLTPPPPPPPPRGYTTAFTSFSCQRSLFLARCPAATTDEMSSLSQKCLMSLSHFFFCLPLGLLPLMWPSIVEFCGIGCCPFS